MKIVLRDDDTCFYTTPQELENAFQSIPDIPISLSIVPYASYEHGQNTPYQTIKKENYPSIVQNEALVLYLKEKLLQKRYEILQHGINHAYRLNHKGQWKTEMRFLSQEDMIRGIKAGKDCLENTLGCTISTFIAPSNDVSADCAQVIDKMALHTNCMLSKRFDRHFTQHNSLHYVHSNMTRFFLGHQYAGIRRYKNHSEINSYSFDSYEHSIRIYEMCKKKQFPMVVYTHYWSLNQNPSEESDLYRFVNTVKADNAEFVFMNQIWQHS